MKDKKTIRREMLDARNGMHKNRIEYYSEIICNKISSLPEYSSADTVMMYCAAGSEVITESLMEKALSDGKTICLPAVLSKTDMDAFIPAGTKSFRTGSFGITEPDPGKCTRVDPKSIDLIILPCVSFDSEGTRLGMGGGYYDRYLKRAPGAYTVAAAFEIQRYDGLLPKEEYDMKTDAVVTEAGIFNKDETRY